MWVKTTESAKIWIANIARKTVGYWESEFKHFPIFFVHEDYAYKA